MLKGSHLSDESKRKIKEHHANVSGKNNPMYGITHPKETIIIIREKSKITIDKKHQTDKWLNVICDWCGNKFHKSPYHICNLNFCDAKCLGNWCSVNKRGNKNPNWKNGLSNEPYGLEFTSKMKEVIKYRDNYKCRMCKSDNHLVVHHIDYNKYNNEERNLITLCKSCHGKTNGHREIFMRLFEIGEFDYHNGGII
jgi:hypothetical protein